MDLEQTPVIGPSGTPEQPQTPVAPAPVGDPAATETVEQLRERKAYYQTKAQQEAEARKALEADLNAARQALEQRTPASFNQQMVDLGIDPATQPRDDHGRFTPTQPATPEYDPNDPSTWAPLITQNVLNALDQRDAQRTKAQRDATYQEGLRTANEYFNNVVVKHAVPEPLIREAMKYAFKYVKGQEPGDPERRATLAIDYIQNNMRVSYGAQIESVQQLSDAQKIEAAKLLLQPAAAAPGAPAPSTQAQGQQRYVDEIAPDDPPVG